MSCKGHVICWAAHRFVGMACSFVGMACPFVGMACAPIPTHSITCPLKIGFKFSCGFVVTKHICCAKGVLFVGMACPAVGMACPAVGDACTFAGMACPFVGTVFVSAGGSLFFCWDSLCFRWGQPGLLLETLVFPLETACLLVLTPNLHCLHDCI